MPLSQLRGYGLSGDLVQISMFAFASLLGVFPSRNPRKGRRGSGKGGGMFAHDCCKKEGT